MKYTAFLFILFALAFSACRPVDLDSPLPVFDTGVDPEAWKLVPAGEFISGEKNQKTALGYDYEMMVTPVTVAQYARYLNAVLAAQRVKVTGEEVTGFYPGDVFHGARHEERIDPGDYLYIPLADPSLRITFDGSSFASQSGWDNHPMTIVTWFGAKAYCDYYGWRLPSEMEWEKAARGTDGRPFPWGEQINRNRANFYASNDPYEDRSALGSRTTPVGFFNGGSYAGYQTLDASSPYGLYDMAGNVWQWTGNVYEGQHYRYMRGGSKDNYAYNLRAWSRNNATPRYYSPAVGFRCARDR